MPNIIGYTTYTCNQGDTYDQLALNAYDDEFLMNVIIEANPKYLDTLVFDGGEVLKIPVIEETTVASTLPPWRK